MTQRSTVAGRSKAASHALFLSYNSADRDAVLRVRAALERRAVATFVDRYQLVAGLPWVDALEDALRKVNAVAVFIGSTGLGRWQKREMQFAMDRQANEERADRPFPVIPVLLPKSDADTAPGLLLLNTWIDLRNRLDDDNALDLLAAASRGIRPEPAKESVILCPYRALQAFREEDALLFFGRESSAAQLFKKVSKSKLTVVTGPSGSGKSSVVQAGLLPLLRKQRTPTWDAVTFTPSDRPFHRMASALVGIWGMELTEVEALLEAEKLGNRLRSGEISLRGAIDLTLTKLAGTDRLLLLIDQFEELFTLTPEQERRAFIEALLTAARPDPVRIVLTLRADFFGQAIGLSRALSDGIQHGLINIGPMTRKELQLAIDRPATSVGLQFEPGLVDRILDHVEQQPGNLPLLQFALTELFGDGSTRLLTHAAYNDIGAVEGAVAKRAETVFGSLEEEDKQNIALRNLSRLVRVASADEEGSDTRQRVIRSELDGEAEAVLQPFVEARLLVIGRDESTQEQTIEVAHEALIRNWSRLQQRVNDDRKFLLWRQRLDLLLSEWERAGKDNGLLLRRAPLAEAAKWLQERAHDFSDRERAFVTQSLREEAESTRLPSWIAAREMTDPLSQTLALADVVEALAGSDIEQAKVAAHEALDAARKIPAEKRSRGLYSAVKSLIKAGENRAALTVARNISDSEDRSAALSRVARDMVRAGNTDEALRVAREIESPYSLGDLARDLVPEGRSQDILRVAHDMTDPEKRARAHTAVVEAMAIAGRIDEALSAASDQSDPYTFGRLAAPLADASRLADLLHAAGALPNLDSRQRAFDRIAAEFIRLGRVEALQAAARTITDSRHRSLLYSGISVGMARAGQHKEAVETAKMIANPDEQSETLSTLADIAARDGKTEDAIAIALVIPRSNDQRRAFTWIADALLKQGKSLELVKTFNHLHDPRIRSRALSGLARAYARTGDIDQALAYAKDIGNPYLFADIAGSSRATAKLPEILEAAGAFSEPRDQRTAFEGIAKEFVHAGKTEVLQDAAMRIGNDRKRSLALAEIAGAVAGTGSMEQARAIIHNISDPGAHSDALTLIAEALVGLGRIDEALNTAKEIREPNDLGAVADTLLRAGRIDESLQVAARISDGFALSYLSEPMANANKTNELLSLAGALPDAESRQTAFGAFAKKFVRFGRLDTLLRAATGLTDRNIRSLALGKIAVEVARTGNINGALKIAQQVPNAKDKASTLSVLAQMAADGGKFEESIALVQQIQSPAVQKGALAVIATASIDLESSSALLRVLIRIPDPVRSFGLTAVAGGFCDVSRHLDAIVLADAISVEQEQRLACLRCARAFARSANIDDLAESLQTIPDEGIRIRSQSRLIQAMLDIGQKAHAIRLSAAVADPVERFRLIGTSLTQAGYVSDALQIAIDIQKAETRSQAIRWILKHFVNVGETDVIVSVARKIDDAEHRSLLLHEISQALLKFSSNVAAIAHEIEQEPARPKRKKAAKAARTIKRRGT